jgi:flagellar basal body P-ring formation protein FlgA
MNKTLTKWGAFVFFFGLFWWAAAGLAMASGLQVLIKDRATIQGDDITLGDIASFSPLNDERVAELKDVVVASSPPPGRDLRLNSRFLVYRLSSVIGGDPDLRFKIPENLLVHRAGHLINAKELIAIFKHYVYRHSPWSKKDIEFGRLNAPDRVMLPRGRITWKVKDMSDGDFVGDTSLVVSFSVDGRLCRKVSVSGRVLVSRKVITTAREVRRGQVIQRQDVEQVTRLCRALRKNDFSAIDDVVGKRATRKIRAGQAITRRMVEIPPIVKKGDQVIIKAENSSLEITTLGRVLEDAHAGEQVKVINTSSGKEIVATAVAPGQVLVTF